tara:strand:- start:8 stop:769 length:762 start_codon:yes stop_codon:yes gene_type:complete
MNNIYKHLFLKTLFLLVFFNFKLFAKENIVADLSENTVEISTTFSGAEILLFGAYDGKKNDDIIVIVTGPKGKIKVEQKEKKFGIWITSKSLTFKEVPKYYYIASNRKIDKITNLDEIKDKSLNLNYLKLGKVNKKLDMKEFNSWRVSLTRNMIKQKFWKVEENSIALNKNTLFRKTLSLPSNVTTGLFIVKILHYRNGILISKEESKINITKSGISANIYKIAEEYSTLYGIFAVVLAVFMGWLSNIVFRRV